MALGASSFRTLAREFMKTREESNNTAGPQISTIVTILLISSAMAWCGSSWARRIECRSTQAARQVLVMLTDRTASCHICFHLD